jgi:hypothetical protein
MEKREEAASKGGGETLITEANIVPKVRKKELNQGEIKTIVNKDLERLTQLLQEEQPPPAASFLKL